MFAGVLVARGADTTNGFAVKFTSADGKVTDHSVLPNLWLFVKDGKPPTPFLPAGKFTAEFNGFIHAELRGTHYFAAEQLSGTLKIDLNGNTILQATANGGATPITKPVQLSKGPNAIKVTLTSGDGDSYFRIGWTEKGTNVIPVPNPFITQARTPELQSAERIQLGRELFLEHRCAACHKEEFSTPVPELAMDAPSFDGIAGRRKAAWLAKWILDPMATRTHSYMPRLVHGPTAAQDAEAMAAWLFSRTNVSSANTEIAKTPTYGANSKAAAEINKRSGPGAKPTLADVGDPSSADDGAGERKPLFDRLYCTGCHTAPGAETDTTKLSLNHVPEKFESTALVDFLKAPDRHFAWTRMPNFKLADDEATELASFLMRRAAPSKHTAIKLDAPTVIRGQKLVQTLGCMNCHTATGLENQYMAPGLAKVPAALKGCLAEKTGADAKAPDFGFDSKQREALVAFLKTDRASLNRHAPVEFAERQTRLLQCNACHGQIDLVPPMEILGGKLRPEWTSSFLSGQPFKVRADIHPRGGDWVASRMPAFRSRAALLAEALAAQQGHPPKTADMGPIDEEAARIGHRMIGKDNGLSCISCHAVNDLPALEVFESEGTNLGISDSRLLKSFFFRWMRNPLAIDPQSKMPAFFDEEGRSALTDYYDGDAEKQINALYQYLRLRDAMPKPVSGE